MVKVLQNGTVLPTPFLDLSAKVELPTSERGLLGLAFDPGFATNRRFYVDYIDKTTLNTVVATYQASASQPNIADTSTAQTVLTVAQPEFANHKAGWIGFRPGENTNLYIATGDGGSANDPQNRAQNLNENLGKILRVDVSADHLPADPTRYGYGIPTGNIAAATRKFMHMGYVTRIVTASTGKPALFISRMLDRIARGNQYRLGRCKLWLAQVRGNTT